MCNFYYIFFRTSPPKDELPPVCTDMLLIDKVSQTMTLENCGEDVPIDVFAPEDYDPASKFLRLRPLHVYSFMDRLIAKKEYNIDERTCLRVANRLLQSVLDDEMTVASKKSLRFLCEQLSYLDGTAQSSLTFSTALIRLCATLRGLSPECYDVLVNERVLNLPPRRFFLAHGAPTNWELKRQIKDKEAEVRQKKIDGLRLRAEKVRLEKMEMCGMQNDGTGKKKKKAKKGDAAAASKMRINQEGDEATTVDNLFQDGQNVIGPAADGSTFPSEFSSVSGQDVYTIHGSDPQSEQVVVGGVVMSEYGQVRYEQVAPDANGTASQEQTFEIVVHPPTEMSEEQQYEEQQQVIVQEVSTAEETQPVIEQAATEVATTTTTATAEQSEAVATQTPKKQEKPKVVRPLKKVANMTVKDDQTAAIKAGMDLALGIAGKNHKKFVRPNKVFADGSSANPDAHKVNPDLFLDVALTDVGIVELSSARGAKKRSIFGDSGKQLVEKAKRARKPGGVAEEDAPGGVEQVKLVPVSFEEIQKMLKAKKLMLVPTSGGAKIMPSKEPAAQQEQQAGAS
jgi:hypothetical protein